MAVSQLLHNTFSAPVNADLHASQFRVMYQLSGTVGNEYVDALGNNGTMPLGILLNKPAAQGRAGRIAGPGCITKLEAGAAVAEGDLIMATTGGRGITATTGTNVWYVGMARESASGSGVYFTCLIQPGRGVQ